MSISVCILSYILLKTIQHRMRVFTFDLKCSFRINILFNGCVMSQLINELIFLSSIGGQTESLGEESGRVCD